MILFYFLIKIDLYGKITTMKLLAILCAFVILYFIKILHVVLYKVRAVKLFIILHGIGLIFIRNYLHLFWYVIAVIASASIIKFKHYQKWWNPELSYEERQENQKIFDEYEHIITNCINLLKLILAGIIMKYFISTAIIVGLFLLNDNYGHLIDHLMSVRIYNMFVIIIEFIYLQLLITNTMDLIIIAALFTCLVIICNFRFINEYCRELYDLLDINLFCYYYLAYFIAYGLV